MRMSENSTLLHLNVVGPDGSTARRFAVRRMVNAGYVGRDRKAVQAHIDELAREGVPPPPSVPMVFPVLCDNVTTAEAIEVIGDRTSGEAEYVLLLADGEVLVGIGSDHTDRELERHDIVRSKQVCKNVMSADVWRLDDVREVWDELLMQCWVRPTDEADEVLYQQAPLGKIISPDELVKLVRSRLVDGDGEGLAIFSGTVAVLGGEMIYGRKWRVQLLDKRSGRSLDCRYTVRQLEYLK